MLNVRLLFLSSLETKVAYSTTSLLLAMMDSNSATSGAEESRST